jgi:hypothetical protein
VGGKELQAARKDEVENAKAQNPKSEIRRKIKAPNPKRRSPCVCDAVFVFSVVLRALRGSVVEGEAVDA